MPSILRSKIQSGPSKRSCVSVAAIGSNHSGDAGGGMPARGHSRQGGRARGLGLGVSAMVDGAVTILTESVVLMYICDVTKGGQSESRLLSVLSGRIRARRRDRGLSLDRLAALSEVS